MGRSFNSDASDFVLAKAERQAECVQLALKRGGLVPEQIDVVSTHATGTSTGDTQECAALSSVFGKCENTWFNNTKSYIGHAMGAAGALELAGNLATFQDGVCHPTINVDRLDPDCRLKGLVVNEPREVGPAAPMTRKFTRWFRTPRPFFLVTRTTTGSGNSSPTGPP